MKTVLIVDDLSTSRDLLGKIVQSAGFHAEFATDGTQGLELAKKLQPSLILLDVVMPQMNGFEACRKLKQDPSTAKIPVVLVTSKSAESDKFWGKKQGADDHIAKPFEEAVIKDTLRRFVG